MSDSKMKEGFLSKFPVPEGATWYEDGSYHFEARDSYTRDCCERHYDRWTGWQAAYEFLQAGSG